MRVPALLLLVFALGAAGCGVEQRAVCAEYVSCIGARDASLGFDTDVARFESDGGCWGSDAGADLCETACAQGLEFLTEREADLPAECG